MSTGVWVLPDMAPPQGSSLQFWGPGLGPSFSRGSHRPLALSARGLPRCGRGS